MKKKFTAALGAAILTATFVPTDIFAYWTGGYDLVIGGQSVATVKNEESVNAMVDIVNGKLTSVYGEDAAIAPEYSLKAKIVSSEKLSDMKELHDAIASESEHMSEAVRINIDGERTICVSSVEQLNAAVAAVAVKKGVQGAQSGVIELIGSMPEVVTEAEIFTVDEAEQYLEERLTVKSTIVSSSEEEYIPEAEYVDNADIYEGMTSVISSGRKGAQTVTTVENYINGALVESQSAAVVTDEGERAVIARGTKPRPAGVGSGNFSKPASGKITSGFGARWGRNHNGIDIGAPTGTPVYASDDGVVTCSEYKNSFGNLVKIDHQNGYETYYAHNSELLVKPGDVVKKGDLIAKVGSTGNSTGPHCHFEIHYNGELKNPMNYLK